MPELRRRFTYRRDRSGDHRIMFYWMHDGQWFLSIGRHQWRFWDAQVQR